MDIKGIKTMCDKYAYGYTPPHLGRPIEGNNRIDYIGFADHLTKKGYRESTILTTLHYIHKWSLPINEHTITNFDASIETIEKIRHIYATEEHKNMSSWVPAIDLMTPDQRANNVRAFSYNVYLAIKKYLKFKRPEIIGLLHDTSDVKKPRDYVRHGHITVAELWHLVDGIPHELRTLWVYLFFSGARIGETLRMKKNKQWFEAMESDGTIKQDKKTVMKIIVPRSIAKTHAQQSIYIDDESAIEIFIEHIDKIPYNGYVFSFVKHPDKRVKRTKHIAYERSIIMRALRVAMIKAGFDSDKVSQMTNHAFRRSMIHHAYMVHKDLPIVQKKSRHGTVNMTGRYLDVEGKTLEKALQDKMDKKS